MFNSFSCILTWASCFQYKNSLTAQCLGLIEIETSCQLIVLFSKLKIIPNSCSISLSRTRSLFNSISVKRYLVIISKVWFDSGSFTSNFIMDVVLEASIVVDYAFFLYSKVLWRSYKISLPVIAAQAPLSNYTLIVYTC